MRLVKVGVQGYRRFREKSEMNVAEDVVAIVGPNEAGKSSLLQALARLSDSNRFSVIGGQRELTRDSSPPPEQPIVWALFELEDSDRGIIQALPGAAETRWYRLYKSADGSLHVGFIPDLTRPLDLRQKVRKSLRRALSNPLLRQLDSDADVEFSFDEVQELVQSLETEAETLEEAAIGRIESFRDMLQGVVSSSGPAYLRNLPALLSDLSETERAEVPRGVAIHLLDAVEPRFLLFGEEERALKPQYDLSEDVQQFPKPLRSLAEVAGLDLPRVKRAIEEEDHGAIEGYIEKANQRLALVSTESWRQSNVKVHFRVDGTTLYIQVSQGPGYVSIAERSDGLRWFVALLAYMTGHEFRVPPILLVDEAETHLHYDAQADLVRVFSRQTAAAKVIYATHSAGCLPEDLGTGVRVIAPTTDGTSSRIRNEFWQGAAGFSPLIMAMGASVLAFTPTRRAVIAEGPTETLLLPTLLREATRLGVLGFQVAPGLAQINAEDFAALELEAARVVYLVDSDEAGRAIRKKLIKSGIDENRIFELRDRVGGMTIEDFVDEKVYLAAVNDELKRSGFQNTMPLSRLRKRRRSKSVEDWCKSMKVGVPNKRAIAQRILERRSTQPLAATYRLEALRSLYGRIAQALELLHPNAV